MLEQEVDQPDNVITARWRRRTLVIASLFYLLAFTVGTIEIFTIPLAYQPAVSTLVLVIGLGAYTLARTFYTFRWHEGEQSGHTIAGVDLAVSIFLVFSTGGLSSPFL